MLQTELNATLLTGVMILWQKLRKALHLFWMVK